MRQSYVAKFESTQSLDPTFNPASTGPIGERSDYLAHKMPEHSKVLDNAIVIGKLGVFLTRQFARMGLIRDIGTVEPGAQKVQENLERTNNIL